MMLGVGREDQRVGALQDCDRRRILADGHCIRFTVDGGGRGEHQAIDAVRLEAWPEARNADEMHEALMSLAAVCDAEVQANPRFQERLAREVPLGRLVSAREDALFAAYLCSAAADCFVGQVFPVSGGWASR